MELVVFDLDGTLLNRDSKISEYTSETLRLLELHGKMGRHTYVVSASAIEIVELLAERLGFTGAIATEAEVIDGVYTGELSQPFRHGTEKAKAIAELAAEKNYDLSLSFAYSDSHNDLPMLELVGIPVVINPDSQLAKIAYQRGWPVVEFAQPHYQLIKRIRVALVVATAFVAGPDPGPPRAPLRGLPRRDHPGGVGLHGGAAVGVRGVGDHLEGGGAPAVVVRRHDQVVASSTHRERP